MSDSRKVSRRSFLKTVLYGSISGMVGVMATSIFSYAQTPVKWHFKKITLSFPNLPPVYDGYKIIHFSDTHFGFHFNAEHFVPLAESIKQQKPDLIVFTGDLLHPSCAEVERVTMMFSELRAPDGQFAVLGNHDYVYGTERIRKILEQAGFRRLLNESTTIGRHPTQLMLAGVDDQIFGYPQITTDMQKRMEQHNRGFAILLSHAPDFADIARRFPFDLQLSGHSHGGQVRIPWVGHLIAPPYGRKYVDGLYEWSGERLKLFTNRGIGTSRVPIRLLCPAEINLIELRRSSS